MSQAPVAAAAPSPAASGHGVGAPGMWTFLATDVMGFGGLFIAYAVLRVRAESWPDPRERLALAPAAAMTLVLLASSLTMTLATRAADRKRRLQWLGATLALGVAFLAGGVAEYAHLMGGASPMGFSSGLYASMFYTLTGYHALHVVAGVVAIAFMCRTKVKQRALETMALYWHFVDIAWMPILSFLYLLPGR
jgi:heme/copper-type cytochrome/quinol oxidase subunit 3